MVWYDTRISGNTKRPQEEYYAWSWRVQIDLHPDGKEWVWMIEEQNNGPVRWHRTTEQPSYQDIRKWIAAQGWSGDDTIA